MANIVLRRAASRSGMRFSGPSRKPIRQLLDRHLGLAALEADLQCLCRVLDRVLDAAPLIERFPSTYDPAAKAPELVASARKEVR